MLPADPTLPLVKAKKAYVPAVGPRLRKVLHAIFALTAVLGANYPGNEWYERAYKLMQKHSPGIATK